MREPTVFGGSLTSVREWIGGNQIASGKRRLGRAQAVATSAGSGAVTVTESKLVT